MSLEQTITIQDELIERVKNGDTSGYTGLYNLYAKDLYNSIYNLVQHTAEAEDILQESFVTAYQSIDRYQHNGTFRAWIKRIAINLSISRLRQQKNRWIELDTERVHMPEEESIDESSFRFKIEEVQRAINALPDAYRTVFQLYAIENIPQTEIAQMLGIAHNTVRIQYHRAKQKILKSLKDAGYEN